MLTASLVLLMCVHAGALSAYLLRVARRLREAQDVARSALDDARTLPRWRALPQWSEPRVRAMARGALIVSVATMALQLILLGVLVLVHAPSALWWVWGITLAISFLGVLWLDGVRSKLLALSSKPLAKS